VNLTAIRRGDPGADFALKPYDTLVIKPIPQWMEPDHRTCRRSAVPRQVPHPSGRDPVVRAAAAGGLDDLAFPDGGVHSRGTEERRRSSLSSWPIVAKAIWRLLSLERLSAAAPLIRAGGRSAIQSLQVGQQLMSQLRDTKPVGRLVIDRARDQRTQRSARRLILRTTGC